MDLPLAALTPSVSLRDVLTHGCICFPHQHHLGHA